MRNRGRRHRPARTRAQVLRGQVGGLGRRRLELAQPVAQRSRLVVPLSARRLGHLQVVGQGGGQWWDGLGRLGQGDEPPSRRRPNPLPATTTSKVHRQRQQPESRRPHLRLDRHDLRRIFQLVGARRHARAAPGALDLLQLAQRGVNLRGGGAGRGRRTGGRLGMSARAWGCTRLLQEQGKAPALAPASTPACRGPARPSRQLAPRGAPRPCRPAAAPTWLRRARTSCATSKRSYVRARCSWLHVA